MVYNGVFCYVIGFVLSAANSSSTTSWFSLRLGHARGKTILNHFLTLSRRFATLLTQEKAYIQYPRFRFATRPGFPETSRASFGVVKQGSQRKTSDGVCRPRELYLFIAKALINSPLSCRSVCHQQSSAQRNALLFPCEWSIKFF